MKAVSAHIDKLPWGRILVTKREHGLLPLGERRGRRSIAAPGKEDNEYESGEQA
jgi:hypothetical protein